MPRQFLVPDPNAPCGAAKPTQIYYKSKNQPNLRTSMQVAAERGSLLVRCALEACRLQAPGIDVRIAAADTALPAGPPGRQVRIRKVSCCAQRHTMSSSLHAGLTLLPVGGCMWRHSERLGKYPPSAAW